MKDDMKLYISLSEYGEKRIDVDSTGFILDNQFVKGRIRDEVFDGSEILKISVECLPEPYDYFKSFLADRSVRIAIKLSDFDKALAIKKYNPFWTKPIFLSNIDTGEYNDIQQFLIKSDNKYMLFMPLANETAATQICYDGYNQTISFCISTYCGGKVKINAPFAIITAGDNPDDVIKRSYDVAIASGVIKAVSKKEKTYPKELNGLGWCTWNAFYHDVTEEKIRCKLREFNDKGIKLGWLMIDDGWSQVKDLKLTSFCEDREKFPSGLKNFISEIKREFDVKYVGVWHAMTGYWFGIEKDSELYDEQKHNLTVNNAGLIIPKGEFDNSFEFFNTWHGYLKNCGVDFLKIDAQGNALEFYKYSDEPLRSVYNLHTAIEKSVEDNFDSVVINCMGLANSDMYLRSGKSAIIRNSDDFFPDKESSFKSHISQNAYNAIFNDNLFCCDFDMWWTSHISAKQSSTLRLISGGPVYISDKVGETDKKYIDCLTDNNGDIMRCETAAKPTADCLFGFSDVLKLYNKIGDNYVVALFNLCDTEKNVSLRPADIYMEGIEFYIEGNDISGKYSKMNDEGLVIKIKPGDSKLINLMICQNV